MKTSITMLILLFGMSFIVNAEELGSVTPSSEVGLTELELLVKDIDLTDPEQVAALALANPDLAVDLLQHALVENKQNVEIFVSGLLQSEPVLVESLISASAELSAPVTSSVISSAKTTLPEQEQEIVVIALSEGIDPSIVTEPTAAGISEPSGDTPELAEPETPNQEAEIDTVDNQVDTLEPISPPLSGGSGAASPN